MKDSKLSLIMFLIVIVLLSITGIIRFSAGDSKTGGTLAVLSVCFIIAAFSEYAALKNKKHK